MAQKYIYKNFIYQLDEKSNHIVKTIPPRNNPEVVYKYYSISENSISALQNLRLYATHPYSFNDSVDSSELILNFKDITRERFENFHKQMLAPVELNKLDLNELFEQDKKRNFYNFRNFTFNYFTRNIGLISLTTVPFNILMWSHYTNESGFVIEFDTENLLKDINLKNRDITNYCFRPVQYVEDIEFINMFDKQFSTPDIPFLYSTNIKRKEWIYEDEWRLGIYKRNMGIPFSSLYPGELDYQGTDNRFFNYSKNSIESISLGKHFFSGLNCDKVINDNGIIVTLKERSEEKFKDTDKNFIEFVNHLFENYNDKLYMSGEYEEQNKLKRSLGQISLERVSNNIFKIIDLKRIVLKD
ncbi:DUF2971 domain-containing protein [uncultured Chryseobacterium sp.]|uniref:DUF2971 domain-containing protein n=1 Tax=uncultured Chryseobacterium sp. TaxID=259322 RepID=UPI0025D4B9BE|nr:DUF2971 domain-containing protein [uncultured Chryseobacterium sp.]